MPLKKKKKKKKPHATAGSGTGTYLPATRSKHISRVCGMKVVKKHEQSHFDTSPV
jgi:hypothetical protein